MGRKSSIRRMPPELRRLIDDKLKEGVLTLTELTELVQSKGGQTSRSALHRYSQQFEELGRELRYAEEMAKVVGRELADESTDRWRMVIESLNALLLRARMQLSKDDELDTKQLRELASSAKDLAYALKATVDVEAKIAERVRKESAANAEKVAKAQGASTEFVQLIKDAIMGKAA